MFKYLYSVKYAGRKANVEGQCGALWVKKCCRKCVTIAAPTRDGTSKNNVTIYFGLDDNFSLIIIHLNIYMQVKH